MEGLGSLCPHSLLVSEESAHASAAERTAADFVWLIDPLDGTKEFIKRNGQFSVNIGLCFRGAPILGVIGAPLSGDIYIGGEIIKGSWLIKKDSKDILSPLQCLSFRWDDNALKATASSSHNSPQTCAFLSRLNSPQMVQIGYKLYY